MKISKTNQLLGLTPTISVGSSSDTAKDLTDPDHSTNYTSSNTQYMTVDFGAQASVNYVAVSGHNVTNSSSGTGRITVQDGGGSPVAQITDLARNNVTVIYFDTQTFTNLRVVFEAIGGHDNGGVTVSYIAAGQAFDVPNFGEVGGHNRNALTRSLRSRVTTNSIAAPVAITKVREALKGRLNLPNMTKEFVRGEWQTFLDFSTTQPFFILEDETDFSSAYTCFEPTYQAPRAHGQTRALDNISIGFKVFNGL
jgi:hypothetical protein